MPGGGKEVLRTCLGCGRRQPKADMLRIVWQGGGLRADYLGRLPGRAGYFCGDSACARRLARGRLKGRPPGNCREAEIWQTLLADIDKSGG